MPSGGKRPNAGRPRKAVKHARPIAQAEKKFADKLPEVAEAMIALALGVSVKDGENTRVYTRQPDFKAAAYVMDRILGKPTERTEVTGDQGGPLRFAAFEEALAKAYPAIEAPKPPPQATAKAPAKPKPKAKAKSTKASKTKRARKPKA